MKYTLINCYSDNNKGDSGIILSTVELLKEFDSNADIVGVSTYNFSDNFFHTEHEFLKSKISVLPSIFGELNIGSKKGIIHKNIRFFYDSIRLFVFLAFPKSWKKIKTLIFSKEENETIKRLELSDYVISKGGSFICNENDIREKIALVRFIYIFILAFKLDCKVVILCQSIGPVYGKLSIKIINYLIAKCEIVVLREKVCIDEYPYLNLKASNVVVTNDIAFYLDTKNVAPNLIPIDNEAVNVGFTIKGVSKKSSKAYLTMMVDGIKHCVDKYGAIVHIFPHVTIDNDVEVSYQVHKMLDDKYKSKVFLYNEDYNAPELKSIYSSMNYFVGTRLHSTIFAMGEFVPSICISYHGTKSAGIFANYGLERYSLTEYSSENLIQKLDDLVINKDEIVSIIKQKHIFFKNEHLNLFKRIFRRL
ncbi:MAG: hypothetical protein GW823_08240 [Bacteroidetes bacterium]|nr:hypothetical protein [Bacteroidota bacterium]